MEKVFAKNREGENEFKISIEKNEYNTWSGKMEYKEKSFSFQSELELLRQIDKLMK